MTGSSVNLEIRVGVPAGPRLVEDYAAEAPDALGFYRGSPWRAATYREKLEDVERRFDRERRRAMAEAVRPTSEAAAERLRQVVEGDGVFVTTGQQAGLFSGPLYTIHKALTAVRLARALETVLNRTVVPLFWVASEDHDWDEIDHVHVLDSGNDLHRIVVPADPDGPPRSMARRPLGPGVGAALEEFAGLLPPTEFAEGALGPLRAAYRPDATVSEAFTDTLAELLRPFDVCLVEAHHAAIKHLGRPIIERDLEDAAEHERRFADRSEELESAGYHAQVAPLEGATHVFMEDDDGRQRIFRDGDGWRLRRTGRTLSAQELRARLADDPGAFSPGVALRPVVENAVFPTVAYVAGPGELSYYAQLQPLFEAHEIGMPAVFPRHGVTFVERKVEKVLDKFHLQIDDLRRPTHEVAARVLREELPEDIAAAIGELHGTLDRGYARLTEAARAIDPTLEGPIQGARNTGHSELRGIEKKIVQHMEQRNEVAREQIGKARVNLFPEGKPQERIFNVYQYLVRYGPELLPSVLDHFDVEIAP